MALRDDIAAAGPEAWFDLADLALPALYKAGGVGAGTSVRVLIVYGAQPEVERSPVNPGRSSRYLYEEASIVVQAAEVPSPAANDIFTAVGLLWTVKAVEAGNGLHWRLKAVKGVRVAH